MTLEQQEKVKVIVNPLEFSDDQIKILNLARQTGRVKDKTLGRLCDGGAQLILGAGREMAEEIYKEIGSDFSLSPEGKKEMDQLLAMNNSELEQMRYERKKQIEMIRSVLDS